MAIRRTNPVAIRPMQSAELFGSQRRRLPTKPRCNLASICILLSISEYDEPGKQKSLAFALELG
jgi:hypothetical protein